MNEEKFDKFEQKLDEEIDGFIDELEMSKYGRRTAYEVGKMAKTQIRYGLTEDMPPSATEPTAVASCCVYIAGQIVGEKRGMSQFDVEGLRYRLNKLANILFPGYRQYI